MGEPWWSSEEVFDLVGKALKEQSFCILDDFLPDHVVENLHRGIYDSKEQMVTGATGAAGKVLNEQGYSAKLDRTLNERRRGDLITFCDDGTQPGSMPGCLELQKAVDGFVEGLKSSDAVAERLRYVDFANGAMFAIYPGGASRYVRHVDNSLSIDGRRLTVILYLNKDWQPEHGGQIRLFEPTVTSTQVKTDVDPLWNRLLIFWSNDEVPHEVLSAYVDRAAVSIWYLCVKESLGNQEAFERLFNPEK